MVTRKISEAISLTTSEEDGKGEPYFLMVEEFQNVVEAVDTGLGPCDVVARARALISEARDTGLAAKPFARLEVQLPGTTFFIRGPNFLWRMDPVQEYERVIPAAAMRALTWATAKGFEVGDLWVARPAVWDAPQYKPEQLLFAGIIEGVEGTGQTIRRQARRAGKAAKVAAKKTGAGLSAGLAALASSAEAASLAIKDPVLTVQLSSPTTVDAVLVEISRWE